MTERNRVENPALDVVLQAGMATQDEATARDEARQLLRRIPAADLYGVVEELIWAAPKIALRVLRDWPQQRLPACIAWCDVVYCGEGRKDTHDLPL